MPKIQKVFAREILNSKGTPTIETTIVLDNNARGTASCPTGTSVSKFEALDLRDKDQSRHDGKGVLNAINNITSAISPIIIGMDAYSQHKVDKTLIHLDGTKDKSKLGGNAILSVSMAVAKAAAKSLNIPLFMYLRKFTLHQGSPFKIPTPVFNILNGGKHAGNNLDFQEFLVIPATSFSYEETIIMATTIYESLKKVLKGKKASTLIGDEGGFAPSLDTNRDALSILKEAIALSKFRLEYDVFLGIDAAANSFYSGGRYHIKDQGGRLNSSDLIEIYKHINKDFSLIYLEDPFSEDDWDGWKNLTKVLSENTLIIGDDLTSTNIERLQLAIQKDAINGIIIKPNQIGTVIEAIATAEVARISGLKIIASHRSGETNDDFIADFSVAISADYAKFGAPARGERVAKYNRLLEISAQIKNLH